MYNIEISRIAKIKVKLHAGTLMKLFTVWFCVCMGDNHTVTSPQPPPTPKKQTKTNHDYIFCLQRAEKEKTGEDNVVSSGGWCIRNSSEKDGEFAVPTGIHRTDVTLANAYSKFFKGMFICCRL